MKCKAEELSKVLTRLVRFVPRMTINESMKTFRFNGKTVQASGHTMGCLASLPEGLDFESPVCIDAKTTASLVQIMRDEVEIEVAENRAVRFTDKNASFRVPVLVIDELPQFPECSEQFVKAPYIHQDRKSVV